MSDSSTFIRAAALYPQPVAFACGRIAHAWTEQDRLDAVLRAGETLTRYLVALALGSVRARNEVGASLPKELQQFTGNLSFGQFLTVVQAIGKDPLSHPLQADLARAISPRPGKPNTDEAIQALLKLRNERGHDLLSISPALAAAIFEESHPDDRLEMALASCEPLLTYPLFLVEKIEVRQKRLVARRLLLMGDSADPRPEEIELSEPLAHDNAPYIGIKDGVIHLSPYVLWDIVPKRSTSGMYFIDKLDLDRARLGYKTANGDEREPTDPAVCDAWRAGMAGEVEPTEPIRLSQTESFLGDWLMRRRTIEEAIDRSTVKIPWHQLDEGTLRWYGLRLGAPSEIPALRSAICERLLDGRQRISPEEARQIVLLFGQEPLVRGALRRDLIDCRAQRDPAVRLEDREESSANILHCLRRAIEFFGRHIGVDGLTVDGLAATSGSADYIAMREALVNLFIHQDYGDPSTAGQITIAPERVIFFNAGRSLVTTDALVDGARSQSRNPIISRALRLIGFAELAGSGLQQVQYVWRTARRRPPIFQSGTEANTFTLILDWRPLPDTSDAFWKAKLGVSVSAQEAAVLALSAEPGGVSLEQIASSQGLLMEDAAALAEGLVRKALVRERQGGFAIQEHLQPLVENQP